MNQQVLIYGANGYSGELIAREFSRRGVKPIVAGQSETAIRKLAHQLDFPFSHFFTRCF